MGKSLLASKDKCTACMACYNVCGHQAIEMIEDEEGFFYPQISPDRCIQCGLCSKRCPEVKDRVTLKTEDPKVFALINHKDATKSSSGGAFSLIARWIIGQGGIVYGATMDTQGNVYHTSIESLDELYKLQGSKYVQSFIGDSYKKVKRNLVSGQKVLFVGTACQVSGLYAYLNNRYEGLLYTIDLICHGVPSNKSFRSYIEKLKEKRNISDEKLENFAFRKLDGWAICPSVKFTKAKLIYLELAENAFMSSFFKGILFRESCYSCSYCNINRLGTFTLADYWGIGKHGYKFKKDVSKGVSLLIDNEGKFSLIDCRDTFFEERALEEAVIEQENLKNPIERHPYRDFAVKQLTNKNIDLDEYCKNVGIPTEKTFLVGLSIFVKHLLLKLGLFNLYKKLQYKYLI